MVLIENLEEDWWAGLLPSMSNLDQNAASQGQSDEIPEALSRSTSSELFDWSLWEDEAPWPEIPTQEDVVSEQGLDFAFPGFDSQFTFTTTDEPAACETLSSQSYSKEDSYSSDRSRNQSFFSDSLDPLSSLHGTHEESKEIKSHELGFPSGSRSRTSVLSRSSSISGPVSLPSPSPRRTGRLSDIVRKGMEELKHAKGACWRCKILRKKVSINSNSSSHSTGALLTIVVRCGPAM